MRILPLDESKELDAKWTMWLASWFIGEIDKNLEIKMPYTCVKITTKDGGEVTTCCVASPCSFRLLFVELRMIPVCRYVRPLIKIERGRGEGKDNRVSLFYELSFRFPLLFPLPPQSNSLEARSKLKTFVYKYIPKNIISTCNIIMKDIQLLHEHWPQIFRHVSAMPKILHRFAVFLLDAQ